MIGDYYSATRQETHGADELLPLMILAVVSSGLEQMATQAYYIKRMRCENMLTGEGEYYLTTFEGALDYIIRSKTPKQQVIRHADDDLSLQMQEIDKLASANITPALTPEPSPKVAGHSSNHQASLASQISPLLWESNEKFLTLKSKPLKAMFVGDLERLHYEYMLVIDKYRSLSSLATKIANQRVFHGNS